MGTEIRYRNVSDVTSEKELFAKWAIIQEDDVRKRGEDSYNGAFTQVHLSVSRNLFKTYKEAVDFAQNREGDLNKGDAVAYKYGEKPGFPRTKADVELVERITVMQKELDYFYTDIVKRFIDSKSSSKKCAHCDSVISKKSRKHVAYSQTRSASIIERHAYGLVTDCPACGGNLLVTDTDKKRLESLTKRHREAVTKQQEALTSAKKNFPAWGYYIAAAVPS
jgi:hypothetical protein